MPNGSDESKAYFAGQQSAQIESLFSDVAEIKAAVCRIEKGHEKRIQSLERWRTGLAYAWALLLGLLGINQAK